MQVDYWDGFDAGVDAAIRLRPHARAIMDTARRIQRWFRHADVHVEQRQRGRGAAPRRWPDIQFVHPERHRATHVEIDTTRRGMLAHIADHLRLNPGRRGVFLRIDPRTGALIERAVYPAHSGRTPVIERGTPAAPLVLRREDVFDAFDRFDNFDNFDG